MVKNTSLCTRKYRVPVVRPNNVSSTRDCPYRTFESTRPLIVRERACVLWLAKIERFLFSPNATRQPPNRAATRPGHVRGKVQKITPPPPRVVQLPPTASSWLTRYGTTNLRDAFIYSIRQPFSTVTVWRRSACGGNVASRRISRPPFNFVGYRARGVPCYVYAAE